MLKVQRFLRNNFWNKFVIIVPKKLLTVAPKRIKLSYLSVIKQITSDLLCTEYFTSFYFIILGMRRHANNISVTEKRIKKFAYSRFAENFQEATDMM